MRWCQADLQNLVFQGKKKNHAFLCYHLVIVNYTCLGVLNCGFLIYTDENVFPESYFVLTFVTEKASRPSISLDFCERRNVNTP